MAVGNWFIFDKWLENIADAGGNFLADDVYAVLCGSAQSLDRTFVGSSTDCRYADLTAELSTGSGYTAGGIILPNKTVTRSSGVVTFDADPWQWTISAPIGGAKYCVLYAAESANDDLIAACDLDTGGGTVTLNTGSLIFTPALTGIIKWTQP
jgi:hypothetical protein